MVMPYLYRVLVLHLGFGLGIDQFELDFLDIIDSISTVVHFNLLTERLTPILPDVQGKPALGLGDRFVAFSGLEGNGETDPAGPTDLFAVDVQAAVLRPLDIPRSRDRELRLCAQLRGPYLRQFARKLERYLGPAPPFPVSSPSWSSSLPR